MLIWLTGTIIISYTIGSVPFGLILGKLMGYGDIRTIGSGNIGATNAMRTGNKILGISTLLLDSGKGALAVWLCHRYYGTEYAPLSALFVVLGHVFPVWLNFKGGKGVATALGTFFALNWTLGGIVCLLWLLIFAFSRISSISSLVSIGYASIIAYVVDGYLTALLCLCIAGLILFTHRANILRLLAGTENHLTQKG